MDTTFQQLESLVHHTVAVITDLHYCLKYYLRLIPYFPSQIETSIFANKTRNKSGDHDSATSLPASSKRRIDHGGSV